MARRSITDSTTTTSNACWATGSSMSKSSSDAAVMELRVGGMDCAACAAAVEKAVCTLPGVREVRVDVMKGRVRVEREGSRGQGDIARAIRGAGYTVEEDAKPAAPAIAPRVWSASVSGLLLGLGM